MVCVWYGGDSHHSACIYARLLSVKPETGGPALQELYGLWCGCCNMQLHCPCSSCQVLCSPPPCLLPRTKVLTFTGQLCPVEFSPPAVLHKYGLLSPTLF